MTRKRIPDPIDHIRTPGPAHNGVRPDHGPDGRDASLDKAQEREYGKGKRTETQDPFEVSGDAVPGYSFDRAPKKRRWER